MSKKILHSIAVLFFGIVLGTVSKFLDTTPSNELPFIIERLDVRNFLGRFAIWILIAVCISIYSNSSIRAAVNVFTSINEQISNFAQTYPTNFNASSMDLLLFMS